MREKMIITFMFLLVKSQALLTLAASSALKYLLIEAMVTVLDEY